MPVAMLKDSAISRLFRPAATWQRMRRSVTVREQGSCGVGRSRTKRCSTGPSIQNSASSSVREHPGRPVEEVLGDAAVAVAETDRERVTAQHDAALLSLAGMLVPVHVPEVVRAAVVVVAEALVRLDGDQGAPAPAVAGHLDPADGVAVQVAERRRPADRTGRARSAARTCAVRGWAGPGQAPGAAGCASWPSARRSAGLDASPVLPPGHGNPMRRRAHPPIRGTRNASGATP